MGNTSRGIPIPIINGTGPRPVGPVNPVSPAPPPPPQPDLLQPQADAVRAATGDKGWTPAGA